MNKPAKTELPSNVYAKIAAVQGELAQTGIGKDSKNTFDKYMFRGIDAVYNALAPLLAKHGLCVLPRMLERDLQERQSRKGDPMFYVTVTAEFDFVSAEDGSTHTIRTYGEAMDRSDKATNKAMSAAYKYAAFMTFAIPTEGDNDADASTPEIASQEGQSQGDDQGAVDPPATRKNWGGRYPTKTALKKAMHEHHAELRRIGEEGVLDDLDGYLTSPEYQDYVTIATAHAPAYLHGPLPDNAPDGFDQAFALEERARELIMIRNNMPLDKEPAQ